MARNYTTTLSRVWEIQRLSTFQQTASLFAPIEPKKSRGRFFVASVIVHVVLLAALVVAPLFLIDPVRPRRYDVTTLIAPASTREVLEAPRLRVPKIAKPKPIIAPPPAKPFLASAKPDEVKLPEVRIDPKPAPVIADAAEAPAPKPEQPAVRTEVFPNLETRQSAELQARRIQTGGFGDSNGSSGEGPANNRVRNVASLGSFDLPAGDGGGNGSSPARGITGSGFGDAAQTAASGRRTGGSSNSTVIDSTFASFRATSPQVRRRTVEPVQIPVEITSKPRPEYTEDGRRLRIQGEVLLRVLFAASGRVQVLDLIRGLGHGLDESAKRAAEQIQFKPASYNGSPVDSAATIRIAFQLAY